MAYESSTDDAYLDTELTTMTETQDVGRRGSVTTTREVEVNPSYDPQMSRQISFLPGTTVVQSEDPGWERQDTHVRVKKLVSGVKNSNMRDKLERDINGGAKPRMSMVANHMVGAYNEQERKTRNYQIVGAIIFVLLAISIASNLGTSWYSVIANKETKTETVAAVPDAYAVNGSNTTTHKVLTDMDGVALRTDRSLDRMKLTSELSDDTWANLEQLHIKGTGGAIHFNVLGWARFDGDRSRCGTVVVVYTIAGHVQFDGTAMTFSNDVAGAFVRAGFPVSTGRRTRQVDDASGYTLTGIQEVFGAFSFVAKLDTSNLSCGDDIPNITNNPFAGLLNDFYLVESHLYTCNEEGRPDCPSNSEVFTILDQSYYKRVKHTRAKKLGDKWVFVARTTVPEASGAGVGAGSRANVLVEMSNGTHVMSYTEYSFEEIGSDAPPAEPFEEDEAPLQCFWNRTLEKKMRPLPFIDSAEETGGLLDFVMDFVGYDVVNGEYVRHYTLTAKNQSALEGENITTSQDKLMVNMFESYEQDRLYSLGIFAPLYYSTYDIIDTNPDSAVLQGANMPPLPTTAEDVSTWLSSATCPGGAGEENSLVFYAEDAEEAALIADMMEVPDIAKYNSVFLYTDEAAVEARLQRAMTVAKDEAEVLLSLNGTNTSEYLEVNSTAGGGRFRRALNSLSTHQVGKEEVEEQDGEVDGVVIDLVVHEGMAFALAKHIEEGSTFGFDQICAAKDACLDLFTNVSTACCDTKASCRKCLGHLNVHRPADPTSELATSTQARTRQRRALPGFSFKMACNSPWRTDGALWSGSPIKYYLEVCRIPITTYYNSLLTYCKRGCTSCRAHRFFFGTYYTQRCSRTSYRYESLEGGLEVKACLAKNGVCGNPRAYIEGKLWVELHRTQMYESGAGGEIKVGVKFKILGKWFDFNIFGGLFFYFMTATLKVYAGRGMGCCGVSGSVAAYLTWTPAIPLPRPPTGAGVEAEGCIGWGWAKVCASLDFPIGI
eukprot:m.257564 g.257564  ORF g.257564 m.257564 type:complete len:999 (-) comp35424_c0_seq1:341-3337(-)